MRIMQHIQRVPKLAALLFQTRLIQFVVHEFQRNILHCTILTLFNGHTHYDIRILPCVLSVTSYYVRVCLHYDTFNALLLTKGSSSSVPV